MQQGEEQQKDAEEENRPAGEHDTLIRHRDRTFSVRTKVPDERSDGPFSRFWSRLAQPDQEFLDSGCQFRRNLRRGADGVNRCPVAGWHFV